MKAQTGDNSGAMASYELIIQASGCSHGSSTGVCLPTMSTVRRQREEEPPWGWFPHVEVPQTSHMSISVPISEIQMLAFVIP